VVPLTVQPNVLVVNATVAVQDPGGSRRLRALQAGRDQFRPSPASAAARTSIPNASSPRPRSRSRRWPFKGTPEVIAALLSDSVHCYWSRSRRACRDQGRQAARALRYSSGQAQSHAAEGADHAARRA